MGRTRCRPTCASSVQEDLAALGFFVCVTDLEDEVIRAAGPELIEAVLDTVPAPLVAVLDHTR